MPKHEHPAPAPASAAPCTAVKELVKRILRLGDEQVDPLTAEEKCALLLRFTSFVPPPPARLTAEEAAAEALARETRAKLEADARDALDSIELYETNGLGQHLVVLVFRPMFLKP